MTPAHRPIISGARLSWFFISYWDRDPRVTLAALAHPGLPICRAYGAGRLAHPRLALFSVDVVTLNSVSSLKLLAEMFPPCDKLRAETVTRYRES